MTFKRITLICLSVLLFFCACSAKNDVLKLSESLSGDYSFRLNVQSEMGELLFGGMLAKQGGEYVYVLDHPKQSADAKYKQKDGKAVLEIGDVSIDISPKDCKICSVFDALEKMALISGNERCERVKLYGEDCMKISLDGTELYFANNKPLLLVWDGIRAEITGFTYGKDDNFGHKDQESVA